MSTHARVAPAPLRAVPWTLQHDQLVLNSAQDGEVYVIAPEGEIDLASVGALRAALARAERSGRPEVVVDLGAVHFIDSTGLQALVDAQRRIAGSGTRRLLLLPGPPPVQRILRISGLQDFFTIAGAERA